MKKKILVLLIALVAFGTVQAQKSEDHNGFKKGDKFVSGLIGYKSVSNPDGVKSKSFKVSPRMGFFLNDFVAIGGRLGYDIQNSKDANGNKTYDNSTITVEAFGRYYLLPGSAFSVFGELGVGYGATRNINHDWDNGINVGFSPGLSYFVGQHFALEAVFGIMAYHSVSPAGASGSTDEFNIGVDLENISFGIIYKF